MKGAATPRGMVALRSFTSECLPLRLYRRDAQESESTPSLFAPFTFHLSRFGPSIVQ